MNRHINPLLAADLPGWETLARISRHRNGIGNPFRVFVYSEEKVFSEKKEFRNAKENSN